MTGTGRWRGDLVVLLKTAIFLWGRAVGRMPAKEQAMIELTEQQLQALDRQTQPAAAVDPRTGQVYRLIKQEVYEGVCGLLRPLGRGWDNPADDDLIRRDG